jgi:branched-chain amino acid transport system ATP-binding protein
MHNRVSYNMWHGVLRDRVFREKEREMNRRAQELLDVFGIADKADYVASQLPYGEQRKLEICRALASEPKLLLLDEPAAGMNPNETLELRETVRKVRDDFGIAILLIEHDMKFVMGICEEITVLEYGRIIAHGDPESVSNDPRVIAAYLGGDDD